MQVLCEICGNEMDGRLLTCPFCGTRRSPDQGPESPRPCERVVNLEQGMPTVDQALERLHRALDRKVAECRILTLIHGYGSSGRGGAIRSEVRRQLAYLKEKRVINDFLAGEEFSRRTGPGRQLLRRFPFLAEHRDLNRANPGITLVVL